LGAANATSRTSEGRKRAQAHGVLFGRVVRSYNVSHSTISRL
jgi:uncharacterized protein YbjQ (UPF0145 family)